MKKHQTIIISLVALTTFAACGSAPGLTDNSSTGVNEAQVVAVENNSDATGAKNAYELLAEAIPTDSEILAEVVRHKSDNDAAQRISLSPTAPDFSFMKIVEDLVAYDAETGEQLADDSLATVGDTGIIDIKVYYEEYGINEIVIEGLLKFYYEFDGSSFQIVDMIFEAHSVTGAIEGGVVNIIRVAVDPEDPNRFLPGVTVIASTTDAFLGNIERAGVTDENGYFKIKVFSGYQYTVSGYLASFENGSGGQVSVGENEKAYASFHMWPLSNDSSEYGIVPVRGYVYDLNYNTVDGAIVKAINPYTGNVILSTTVTSSDENGYFELLMPTGVTALAITANYANVSTVEEIGWPNSDIIELVVPGAAPTCSELQVNSIASPGEELTLTLITDNPMDGILSYIFDSPDGGSFPFGQSGFSNWNILVLPTAEEGVIDSYTVFARATNTFGSCAAMATISIFTLF